MQRKFILCPFRNGDFCLLIISVFLNSVYAITAQKSVINSKNLVQRIFFELLYRVYKTPKFLGYVLYECPSIKYVPSECWDFIHPTLQFTWIPFWWPLSQQCAVRFLPSPSAKKKTLKKLFRFIYHLWKSLLLNVLFSDSHVRADNPGGQCVKDNVGVKHIFEHLLGQFFSPWLKLKQSSKRFSNRHFSKYLPNNSRAHSNHHKNYAKTVLH